MNRRILSVILLSSSGILVGSGILMYFLPFDKLMASLHTFFALFFIIAIVFHVFNNKVPIKNYLSGKRLKIVKKLQAPIIFFLIVLLAIGVYFDMPILNRLYAFGNEFRNSQLGKTEVTFDYQIIDLEETWGHYQISVEVKKGSSFQYPLFAIWLEDTLGNYIETLYISRVIASSTFDYGKKVGETWEPDVKRRPEALPYWSHKRGIKAADGLFMPLGDASDLDGVSGATATSNFQLKTNSDLNNSKNIVILLEVNQSYDWNEFYSSDRFPDDKIYSGSGQVGQPSLIYQAQFHEIKPEAKVHKLMELIGHGHHSGRNGELFTDLTQITTAKNILERIIVTIQ